MQTPIVYIEQKYIGHALKQELQLDILNSHIETWTIDLEQKNIDRALTRILAEFFSLSLIFLFLRMPACQFFHHSLEICCKQFLLLNELKIKP